MQIEVHGETERVIQEQLQAGRFSTAEAVVDAAVREFAAPATAVAKSRRSELEARMVRHGIRPLVDGTELYGDFWPEDQSVDEFLETIHQQRRVSSQRWEDVQEAFE